VNASIVEDEAEALQKFPMRGRDADHLPKRA